ncbi:hypothetical protein Ddye_028840, partial [Dipteronia dyeriana]
TGQLINYEKSSLCVSRVASITEGDRLVHLLSVRRVQWHDKYLGLPSFSSRNKLQLFRDLKERIWRKICGWRGKLLSTGGKEILIKVVIQSIPTYSMGLFQLPISLLNDLHRMFNRFLWGSTETNLKLHWASGKAL